MTELDRRQFVMAAGATSLLFAERIARAQEAISINGFWWVEQNALARFGYVVGYVDATTQAFAVLPAIHQQAKMKQTPELVGLWEANFDYNGISFGQFVEGMDKFYEDFRNKRINARDAMNYVKNEVKGVDAVKQQATLLQLRKWAAKEN